MHSFDIELTAQDLQDLHSPDAVTALFKRLGYDTPGHTMQTSSHLGIPQGVTGRSFKSLKEIRLLRLRACAPSAMQNFLLLFIGFSL